MLYRNAPRINRLFLRSSEWRRVAQSATYLAFDEWWGGLKEHMPAVIGAATKEGSIRAYTVGRP